MTFDIESVVGRGTNISGQVVWFIKTALEKALRTKRKSYMELKIVSSNKKIKRDPLPFGFPCMECNAPGGTTRISPG